jgi:hypothetical protein
MADNEKDVPIKEQEDGSVLAKIEMPEEAFVEEDAEEKKEGGRVEATTEEIEEDADHEAEHADDEQNFDESEEDREKIREARREERRLKKELAKQREASSKHKISALEKRNEELLNRLAKVENNQASFQFAQLDKTIEDEATRVEYAKMKMLQAAQTNDAAAQVEYLEQLTDAKQRLQQIQHFKKQQLELASKPKQNVPTPMGQEVQRNATQWLKRNSWYDPDARDTDSRIAKVIDQELVSDGWDPSDSEYWDELDNRLSARLPHRYNTARGAAPTQRRSAGPTASSRVANTSTAKPNSFRLNPDRVQAIKDAGAWDNVDKRNKMIRAYASYDRANKGD